MAIPMFFKQYDPYPREREIYALRIGFEKTCEGKDKTPVAAIESHNPTTTSSFWREKRRSAGNDIALVSSITEQWKDQCREVDTSKSVQLHSPRVT